jgi:predicted transcriptional regulator
LTTKIVGNTLRITMKTVTLKIPEALDAKIRRLLKRRKESFSELARRALSREVEDRLNFADVAKAYRGMFVGPGDLSMREGYGSRDNR